MRNAILLFVFGLVVGVAAGVVVPRWAGPRLPHALRLDESVVEGTVVAKQRRDGELLLTVDTADGAVLATFGDKVDAISLLIDEGDTVGLGLQGYEPFADDPPIRRVIKKKPFAAAEVPSEPAARGDEPPGAVEAMPEAPQTRPGPSAGSDEGTPGPGDGP